ncbi:MAG: hypothetical protein JXP73_00110 [Deltaproteobacteria bacterium]|nr:hypothetical protein [Deltaproteobacteria bacterium]
MTRRLRCAGMFAIGCLWTGGCALDSLGYEEEVTRTSIKSQQNKLEDDRIEDKHPVFDASLAVAEAFGSCTFTLYKSGSVTKLSVAPYEGEDKSLAGALFPNRGAALAALQASPDADVIPSMETVNGHLKPFNDGLYAAIEIAVEKGVPGGFAGKRQLLADILSALVAMRPSAGPAAQAALNGSAAFIGAALILSGVVPALPATVLADAEQRAADFQAASYYSQPTGFYTWTPELETIFTRDRFLQLHDSFADLAGVALVLGSDPALLQTYQTVVALYAGLTNPYVSYTVSALVPSVTSVAALEDVNGLQAAWQAQNPKYSWTCYYPWVAFLPASRSKDTDYFNTVAHCDWSAFAGINVMDLLIAAIRDGELDLAPTVDSGWYDYQLYALETLLLPERGPESDHLLLTAAYKQKLIDTFKTLITETRETHVKQLAGGTLGMPPVPVNLYPKLPVEPFPTFYLRTARGYRFLDAFLRATLGAGFLDGLVRLREDGSASPLPLPSEIKQTTELVYGLHATACASLGMRPESYLLADETAAIDQNAALAAAQAWLAAWRTDPDVLADPRVIVPIAETEQGSRYWAVIGVKPLRIAAEFVAGYEPQTVSSGHCVLDKYVPHRYDLLVEDQVEIAGTDTAPPTREELRRICDEQVTHDAIVAALQAR